MAAPDVQLPEVESVNLDNARNCLHVGDRVRVANPYGDVHATVADIDRDTDRAVVFINSGRLPISRNDRQLIAYTSGAVMVTLSTHEVLDAMQFDDKPLKWTKCT